MESWGLGREGEQGPPPAIQPSSQPSVATFFLPGSIRLSVPSSPGLPPSWQLACWAAHTYPGIRGFTDTIDQTSTSFSQEMNVKRVVIFMLVCADNLTGVFPPLLVWASMCACKEWVWWFAASANEPDWQRGDFLITCSLNLMSSSRCPSDYFRMHSVLCHLVTALSSTDFNSFCIKTHIE